MLHRRHYLRGTVGIESLLAGLESSISWVRFKSSPALNPLRKRVSADSSGRRPLGYPALVRGFWGWDALHPQNDRRLPAGRREAGQRVASNGGEAPRRSTRPGRRPHHRSAPYSFTRQRGDRRDSFPSSAVAARAAARTPPARPSRARATARRRRPLPCEAAVRRSIGRIGAHSSVAWKRAVSASLLPLHGCRSGLGPDRAPAGRSQVVRSERV